MITQASLELNGAEYRLATSAGQIGTGFRLASGPDENEKRGKIT